MEDLKQRIYFWQNVIAKTVGVEREIKGEITDTLFSKPIKIITGFRRSGKSFLTRQIAKSYVDDGHYLLDNVLYLNFEDYVLTGIDSAAKLGELYELFKTDVADAAGRRLLIFDEIQNVANWDKFIRTIYESEDNIEIIITGSNSELLSSELGSNLAGRFIEFFVLPFSFREFLVYREMLPSSEAEYRRNLTQIRSLFSEFLSYGGLPEVFEIQTVDAKRSYLNGVVTKVVLDDIVKRFNVDNIDALERILAYLLASVGHIVSYSKLTNLVKSFGIDLSGNTTIKYASYFLQTFTLFEVSKFDWKLNKHFPTSRKYYAVDSGLLSLFRFEDENYSFRLENLVFVELLRRKKTVCFGMSPSNKELDFIVQDKHSSIEQKIQVSMTLNTESLKRELKSFVVADKYMANATNLLLTTEESESLQTKGIPVEQVNIIEWLLDMQ